MRRREIIALLGGSAVAWPSFARAQQTAMAVIGYLQFGSPGPFAVYVAAFRQGLSDTGYVDGQNVAIEYRWAEDHYDRLPALAADLAGRKVDVIMAGGPPCARAAKDATSTIPIVFTTADPVAEGLVASLARPGGNLTGFSVEAGGLNPKRLELVWELVPQAGVIALLVNPNDLHAERDFGGMEEAARAKGVQLALVKAGNEREIDAAFASLVQLHARALIVSGPLFNSRREQLVALVARYGVPVIYEWRDFTAAGGLMSYGTSLTAVSRQVGVYVGRILAGPLCRTSTGHPELGRSVS